MKKPKVILFDWDNTLVETGPILRRTIYNRMDQLNLDRELLTNYDKPRTFKERLELAFGDIWQEIWKDCKKDYLKLLEEEGGIKILPGVVELLNQIQQDKILMGVVSNKDKDLLMEEIIALNLEKFFQVIVGSGEAKDDKPTPFPVFLALERLEKSFGNLNLILPYDCWFVGDSDLDASCSLEANLLPVIINAKLVLARNFLQENKLPHLDFSYLSELLIFYKKIFHHVI
jgi:phosphoglycolate phosphatase